MGFVQKVVGDITGANQQADAIRRGAEDQASATRAAAESASRAAQQAAQQSAQQVSSGQERSAALASAAASVEKPADTPEVQVDDVAQSGAAKKRREKFGIGSSNAGVNI